MTIQSILSRAAMLVAASVSLSAQNITLPGGLISSSAMFVQQSFTTGMVGFTTSQTARLNVVNLNPVPSSSATTQQPNCTVQLEFLDDKGAVIKSNVVPNFAPGTATSFDLPRAAVTSATAARAEIRGVVVVNPTPAPAGTPTNVGYCSVMTTLEIFDSLGSTVSSTSDTRSVGGYMFTPMMIGGK